MIELSIIIVNFNVKEYLRNTLLSLYETDKRINIEVIVVDNASTDQSADMVRKEFPDVMLIENEINVGFAKGNNIALKKCSGKYILLINPDTIVRKDTLSKMIDFFKITPDCGAAGCKVLNPDKSLQLACRRGFPTPFTAFSKLTGLSTLFTNSRLFGRYNLTYLDPEETNVVDAISGSFMMIRRNAYEQVGILDEDFFLYGEDIDWCYRIKQKGWKIYYYPETEIIHFKGKSSGKGPVNAEKEFYRSMILFVEKHYNNKIYILWMLKFSIKLIETLSFVKNTVKKYIIKGIRFITNYIPFLKKAGGILLINSDEKEINVYNSLNKTNNIISIPRDNFNNDGINNENIIRKIIREKRINEIQFSPANLRYDDMVKIIDICDGLPINYNIIPSKSNNN